MGSAELTKTLDALIVALCQDYERRRKIIEEGSASHRTDTELRYYNFKMYDAAAEIVGEPLAELFIREIGNKTGYANSEETTLSEVSYKLYKRLIKEGIAMKLHLCDGG